MTTLETRVTKLEDRNKRVELDKAWETSWTRRIVILLITYFILGSYMWIIKVTDPWLNAIIPSLGFMLSTLVMPWVKRLWAKNRQ